MKILIGYDNSPSADKSLADLMNAGLPQKSIIKMVMAVPPLYPIESIMPFGDGTSYYPTSYKEISENQKLLEAKAKTQINSAAKKLQKNFPTWKITTKVVVDAPGHAILLEAEIWKPDLISIGSRGWNVFGDLLLGSVAEKVLNHAHCAVRLCKNEDTRINKSQKLLIAYDGSTFADDAVKTILSRQWPLGTKAVLLAATEFQFNLSEVEQSINKTLGRKNPLENVWPWMDKKIGLAKKKLESAGIKTEAKLVLGEPRRTILDEAKKMRATTIVLGSRGLSGIQRFVIGSISSAVASHANCSVEIIRSKN